MYYSHLYSSLDFPLLGWVISSASQGCPYITLLSLFRTKLTKLGHHRPHEMTIKEEPKSPGCVMTRKRKAYSTTNTNPIGIIEPINDANANPIQPASKRAKTTSASTSHVQFDRVAIPKATRKLICIPKASSKKELFARLGKEFTSISKTCEELSETLD